MAFPLLRHLPFIARQMEPPRHPHRRRLDLNRKGASILLPHNRKYVVSVSVVVDRDPLGLAPRPSLLMLDGQPLSLPTQFRYPSIPQPPRSRGELVPECNDVVIERIGETCLDKNLRHPIPGERHNP